MDIIKLPPQEKCISLSLDILKAVKPKLTTVVIRCSHYVTPPLR